MSTIVVGVDGCRAGWIACRIAANAPSFAVYATFREMLAQEAAAEVIAIDIPIGLRADWTPRACDSKAKSLLGPRRSSIFPAPPRPLLSTTTYKEANDRSKRELNRGLSQQTFHLFPKIREVDAYLRENPFAPTYEVHPELAFLKLGSRNLAHSKKSVQGYEERRQILNSHGIQLPNFKEWRTTLNLRGVDLQRDDLADAAITAVVALRIHRDEAQAIPTDEIERDAFGLPMRISY